MPAKIARDFGPRDRAGNVDRRGMERRPVARDAKAQKAWDHEKMRINSMDEKALIRRVNKIGHKDKLKMFADALEDENHHALAAMARQRAMTLSSGRNFEVMLSGTVLVLGEVGSLVLGDVAGHEFHGNQYTTAAAATRNASEHTHGVGGAFRAKTHADAAQSKSDEAHGHLAAGRFKKAAVAFRAASKLHKKAWLEHEDTYNHVDYRDVTPDGNAASAQHKAMEANAAAAKAVEAEHPEAKAKPRVNARAAAYADAGMQRVRGNMGGTYYE